MNFTVHSFRCCLLLLSCLLLWSSTAQAQWVSADAPPAPASVEDIIEAHNISDAPGGAYLVVQAGQVIKQGYFGKASLEHDIAISENSRFNVASVSKQFTAFAVMQLHKAGKLNLDASVRTYLPEMAALNDQITVRHLLHHTSGLKDDLGMLSLAGWRHEDLISNSDVLNVFRSQSELAAVPGQRYSYSNTNYSLLASIVSRVTGQTFASWTHENIFQPLNMLNSGFVDSPETIIPDRTTSYEAVENQYKRKVNTWHNVGPGGLYTTAGDLGKWVMHLMHDATNSPSILTQMSKRGLLSNGVAVDYAYGLVPGNLHGLPTIGHGGASPGNQSNITIFPEQDLAIIVLGNRSGDTFIAGRIAADIAALYLVDEIPDQPVASANRRAIMITSEDLASTPEGSYPADPATYDQLAGTYQLADAERFQNDLLLARPLIVSTDGERLLLAFGEPPGIPLAPIAEDRFRVIRMNFEVTFQRNTAGQPFGLIFHITEDSIGDEPPQDLYATRQNTEQLKPETLQAYAGLYYSQEIETTYKVSIDSEGQLQIFHPRHGLIPLQFLAPDEFLADTHIFTNVSFKRNAAGQPSEVRLRGFSWESSIVLQRIDVPGSTE